MLGAHAAVAQLLSVRLCDDWACSSNCVVWRVYSGQCSSCDPNEGPCGNANPSVVATLSQITYYYDAACHFPIPGSETSLVYNGLCNTVPGGGSYVALDISAVIGGVVGGVALLVLLAAACACCATDGGRRYQCVCVCCRDERAPKQASRGASDAPVDP